MAGDVGILNSMLIPLILFGALWVIPFWRLLPQFGIPKGVAFIAIFPLFAIILLWVIAFKDKVNGGRQ